MKYILQEDCYKIQKINVKISSFDEIVVSEEDQFFVANESDMLLVEPFFALLKLPFKFVLPPGGMYVYGALLAESDASKLISYEDFAHVVELVPKDVSSLDTALEEDDE